MLFRKKVEHICAHCVHATRLDDEHVLCAKKGVRPAFAKCIRFRYDALKRIPKKARAMDFSKYDKEDFSL